MKKALKVFTICLFAILFLTSALTEFSKASATGNIAPRTYVTSNNDKPVITVGYAKNYGVLDNPEFLDHKGFGYEILKRAEHYSDYRFEFVEYEYFDALQALKQGEIDVMGIVFDSETYEDDYLYVPKALGTAQLILASKENNSIYNNPAEIDGKTVASFYNNPYEELLNDYCEANNISVTYVRDEIESYTKLEADFYLITTLDSTAHDFNMVMNLSVFDLYFITSNKNPQLADSIAESIELSISADGTFLQELQIEYYGSRNLIRRYLTVDELALLQGKTFTCGYIDHHQPIQFTNAEGEADGISVAIMDMLAEEYGFNIEYIPYNHSMPNSSHENFDLLLSATGVFDHEMAFYTPTEPFIKLPMMLIGESNYMDDIISPEHSSQIGMLNYITINQSDIETRYPNNRVKYYDTFDELIDGYISGEVDAILATDNGIEYAQFILGTENYSIQSTGLSLPLRVFVSNNSEHLTEYIGAFNVMFDHVGQNVIDEIISTQYVSHLPEYTFEDFLNDNIYAITIIVLLVIIIIASTIYYLQYKKKTAILKILNYDKLTKLISRYLFEEKANHIISTMPLGEYQVLSLDIDGFHTINAIYNKEKGNSVIICIANELTKAYHGKDALITRITADHFVVLHKVSQSIEPNILFEKHLRPALKEVLGEKHTISVSMGSCIIDTKEKRIDEYVDCAAAARLKGKKIFGLTFNEYTDSIKAEHELLTTIIYRMKDALVNNEFKVVYQPKIKFDTLKVGGAEALVRWHTNSELGMIPPNMFISIFETNGFIADLDLYVFEEVCKFITETEKTYKVPLISVNISTITLFNDKFPTEYLKVLNKYNLSPTKLELEVTESAMALKQDLFVEKIEEIKKLGLTLSIDDFGAGESSLNRLSSIDAHTIKLDKAFLDSGISNKKCALVVENVVNLAKQLNMRIVTEGVETKEQALWLKNIECDLAQGYYFEKPMSREEFIKLLADDKTYVI